MNVPKLFVLLLIQSDIHTCRWLLCYESLLCQVALSDSEASNTIAECLHYLYNNSEHSWILMGYYWILLEYYWTLVSELYSLLFISDAISHMQPSNYSLLAITS